MQSFGGKTREADHLGDVSVDEKVLLRFQRNNLEGFVLGLFALGYRATMSMCNRNNELLGTVTNFMELSL
jgi:hypothetical protein